MCETENLIDLSNDDTNSLIKECNQQDFLPLIPSPQGQRLILENNPFDYVQKLASFQQDDPFDVVEKEVSLKALQSCVLKNNEVRVGNLLSLNDDDLPTYTLENESPPISVKLTPDSGAESSDSSTTNGSMRKGKGYQPYRNRLLKLSISNSTLNTPMSNRKTIPDDLSYTPLSGSLSEHMLDSESPLKLVDDDIMSEEPPETIYTEKDYDADLEMLEIPMLKNDVPIHTNHKNEISDNECKRINPEPSKETATTVKCLPDIEAIRSKLNINRTKTDNNHDISKMIDNLKTLICESKLVDDQKKEEVNCLLETLTLTITENVTKATPPQPITRQGTFDLDLQDSNDPSVNQTNEMKTDINTETITNFIHKQTTEQGIEEIPDIMIKSSATYDGETAEDREHLNLPQIEPLTPPQDDSLHPNINEIMDQLQRFLEQHQTISQTNVDASNDQCTPLTTTNPTFIVVMPTLPQNSINEDSQNSSHNTSTMRRRSQSLSIHDKLKIVQLPIKNLVDNGTTHPDNDSPPFSANTHNADFTEFKTPARFLPRRNSFSNVTPYTPRARANSLGFNKISNSSDSNTQNFVSPIRSGSSETRQHPLIPCSSIGLNKPDLKKKGKTISSIMKANVPLKATIPIKKVIQSKPHLSTSNTSMHLIAKSGHMSNTSTPMPAIRVNTTKVLSKATPSACSTPTGCGLNNARCSNISTTPIRKSLVLSEAPSNNLKRRTISEFKKKSPLKTRSSCMDSNAIGNGTKTTRLQLNRTTLNSKAVNTRSCNAVSNGFNPKSKENK